MFSFLHYFVPSAWITAWTVTLCLWLYCWLIAKHGILHWEILNVFIQVFNGNVTWFFIQAALQYVPSYLRRILLLKGDTVWVFQKHDIQRKCYCSTKYFNAIKLRVKWKKSRLWCTEWLRIFLEKIMHTWQVQCDKYIKILCPFISFLVQGNPVAAKPELLPLFFMI